MSPELARAIEQLTAEVHELIEATAWTLLAVTGDARRGREQLRESKTNAVT